MAERRMFAKTIIDSDAFLDMPSSSQALYFHLNMRADDEGFINNPKKIQKIVGCADDDLNLLLAKGFIIRFDTGVIVIKHWKIHNYIRKDRLNPTVYEDEKSMLVTKENGSYTFGLPTDNQLSANCLPTDNQLSAQVRLGKDSIVKDSIGQDIFSDFAGEDTDLLEALRDFEEMRKKIKKPLATDRAKKNILKKLEDIPRERWIDCIDQSIEHCWQSIYDLHTGKKEPESKYDISAEWLQERA